MEEEEGDFIASFLLNFVSICADAPEIDVMLGLELKVHPLHKLLPNLFADLLFDLSIAPAEGPNGYWFAIHI